MYILTFDVNMLFLLQILEKLLIAAVTDADVIVRRSIFSSLNENGGFDGFLAQANSLTAIFAALNDEVPLHLNINILKVVRKRLIII